MNFKEDFFMKNLSAAAMSCILAASMSVSALAAEENGAEKLLYQRKKPLRKLRLKQMTPLKLLSTEKRLFLQIKLP